ncbi:hypothetical protein PHISCL_02850 [Aspergillus sclerotialis]|uniref:Mediator of RNA polymerase II transcription subunit 17 n=1 Tax=Aspergillus sclerotialis TaxID=2070753 RepID=A0A3A2ZQ44_9EURO|nr:hypothetical protein PHISCL_02850 [Aspergillus sclerotialis]
MFALDFVSLLLSKHSPRQTETSMSAYLKQVAPVGSLNAEIINPPPKPEGAVDDTKAVSRGWRLQSFDAAANKLLRAATRLEDEVATETRYWGEVLAVKDKGWKVCRMPRERQTLGVQYGFLEATPIFRDRGLASLRRGEDGSLVLDKGLVPQRPRAIRVRVKDHGRFTGSSTLHKPTSSAEAPIEGRILQARDTLFEEELFHELIREARTMAGNGVTMRRDSIQVSGADEQEILVDLVDADQDLLPDEAEVTHEDDCLANAISHAIHILLSFSHRQNLHRRMQIPPPLTTKRRHTPEYQLLRPIVAYLQHTSHVRWLESFLQDIYAILKSAGLNCEYKSAHFSSVNLARKDRPMPKLETLVEEFLRPLESTFSGTLTTSRNSFKVNVRTNLSPSFLGTHYDIEINLPEYPQVQPPSRIGLRDEAAAVITQVVMLDLVTAVSLHRPHLANVAVQDETTPEMRKFLTWQPVYPHHGELLASSPTLKHNKKLKVSLSRTELTLRSYYIRGSERYSRSTADTGPQIHSRTWKRDLSGVEQSTMMEFVTEVSKE